METFQTIQNASNKVAFYMQLRMFIFLNVKDLLKIRFEKTSNVC